MIGDKLIIKDKHRQAAEQIVERILPDLGSSRRIYTIAIAGESGSGKSETGQAVAEVLIRRGFTTLVLQQDDYFVYPPKTNDRRRRQDIGWVGMQEVSLDLLDEHLQQARSGSGAIVKPVVVYEEDRIVQETVSLQGIAAVVAEGTYTTVLESIDTRVFIDLTYLETLKSRLERAREAQDDFLERVLEIEHRIISAQKSRADYLVDKQYRVVDVKRKGSSK
jgi:uridine kinase